MKEKKLSFKYSSKIFIRHLYDNNLSILNIFKSLKSFPDYNYKCEVLDGLPGHLLHNMVGVPLPNDIEHLAQANFVNPAHNLLDEINWSLLSIRAFQEEINKFVNLKEQFEKALLLADYKQANILLDEIDSEVCVSIWSIENRMLLYQLEGGLEKNKAFLTKINEKKKNFLVVLADFYSKRAETELLISRYTQEVKTYNSKWTSEKGIKNAEYYHFKTSYYDYEKYENLQFVNAVDFRNSVIDRYLTLVKVIQTYIAQGIPNEELESIKSRVQYLNKKIDDSILKNILKYFYPDCQVFKNKMEIRCLEILDFYTSGDYSEAIFQSSKFLREFPNVFEIYIVYCKSIIKKRREMALPTKGTSLQNSILKEVHALIEKRLDPHITSLNLRKIAYQLSSFSLSSQIMNLVSIETTSDNKYNTLDSLNTSFPNPSKYNVYNNLGDSKIYLQSLKEAFPKKSITIELWKCIVHQDFAALNMINIPEERKLRFKAKLHYDLKEYQDAITIYESFLRDTNLSAPVREEATINLFECYHCNGDFNNAISLYVDTYFKNQYFILRLDPSKVLIKVREARFKGFNVGIDLPLFFSIAGAEEVRVSTALESYLKLYDIDRPAMLLEKIIDVTDKLPLLKIHFLLDQVCTIDLFKHLVPIKTTKEKLNERLKIVEYLIGTNYTFRVRDFNSEYDEITRQIFIQDGLQEYDESKIYINEKMIKNTLLKDLEIEFARYLNYKGVMKKTKLNFLFLNPNTKRAQSVTYEEKEQESDKGKFSADPLFDLVKAMFMEVRNLFIHSQYGLREYLSARIRHGVFKSEIRPKFEKLNLITERNSKTKAYKANEYWLNRLNFLSEVDQKAVSHLLQNFSKVIDDLIEEEGLKKYLLIKTEDINPDGWFDYTFNDDILSYYHSILLLKHNNFTDFVDEIFSILWQRTDDKLAEIRLKFTSEFKIKFEEAISILEKGLLAIIDKSSCHELFENIVTSRVNIQNDMNKISRWFNRIGKQIKEFKLDRIVELSYEHTNKRYDKKQIKLSKDIQCDTLIRGDLSPSFMDLICGFLDNTLKYCGKDGGLVETDIKIERFSNEIHLFIKNDLYGDINSHVEDFETYKIENAESSSEGGSGLKKAKRTIMSDFGDNKNNLEFWIDQDQKIFNVKCIINLEKIKYESANN